MSSTGERDQDRPPSGEREQGRPPSGEREQDRPPSGEREQDRPPSGEREQDRPPSGEREQGRPPSGEREQDRPPSGEREQDRPPSGEREQGRPPSGEREQDRPPSGEREQDRPPSGEREQGRPPSGEREQDRPPSGEREQGRPPSGEREQGRPPSGERDQDRPPSGEREQDRPPSGERDQDRPPSGERDQGRPPSGEREQDRPPSGEREQGRPPSGEREQGRPPSGERDQDRPPSGEREQGRPPSGERDQDRPPSGEREQDRPPSGEREQGRPPSGEREQGRPPSGEREQDRPPSGEREQGRPPSGEREQDRLDQDRPRAAGTLALTVCSAAIGGTFQYGYNISIINAPTSHIQVFINDTYLRRWGSGLEGPQVTLVWTLIVSAFSLGGLLGALLAGPLSVRFGRKTSLLLNNVFLFTGAGLALTCRRAQSFEMIIVARFLVGMNSGVSMNVQPMYFGESAPKHLRGAVAFSSAVFTAFGIFLGQVVGLTGVLGAEPLWPYLLASNAVPGLIQLLTLPWFPESPRYLLMDRGDREACVRALGRLRGGEVPALEMDELLQEQLQQKSTAANSGPEASTKTPWSLFQSPDLRCQLKTVMTASSAMMLCGNDSIYFYASYIFLAAGIPPEKVQYVTIGTGASELTASILSNLLIERVGRRYLLIGGYCLMSCWSVVFTVALTLQSYGVAGMPYLSMACVFAYILSFGLGPAGVTGVLPAEIFDQAARPAAYMVAGSLMWISLFLVGMLFPFIVSTLGNFCFLPFLAVCLASAMILGLSLPETKGKSLSEITAEFDRKNGVSPERQQPRLDKACSLSSISKTKE